MKLFQCIFLGLITLQASSQNCSPDANKRRQISDTSTPVGMIGQVSVQRKFLWKTKNYPSSFAMISSNVLITAGHTFRNRFLRSQVKGITIQLGKRKINGDFTWIKQVSYKKDELIIFVNPQFRRKGSPEYDYSYAALPDSITSTFFMLNKFTDLQDPKDTVIITGYPGDKNYELWLKGDVKANIQLKDSLLALYGIYTSKGDSGAPIWTIINKQPALLGIHGTGNYHGGPCNGGVALTTDRIKELQDFIRLHQRH